MMFRKHEVVLFVSQRLFSSQRVEKKRFLLAVVMILMRVPMSTLIFEMYFRKQKKQCLFDTVKALIYFPYCLLTLTNACLKSELVVHDIQNICFLQQEITWKITARHRKKEGNCRKSRVKVTNFLCLCRHFSDITINEDKCGVLWHLLPINSQLEISTNWAVNR